MDHIAARQEIAELLEKNGHYDKNHGTPDGHAFEIISDREATAGRRLDEEMLEAIRSDYGRPLKKKAPPVL